MGQPHRPRIALYPGTFDPITKGHLDIIGRASHLVDILIVAVAANTVKGPLFLLEERLQMAQQEVDHFQRQKESEHSSQDTGKIIVKSFNHLLVDFARSEQATMIVRGVRAVSDFDYEFQMAGLNKAMAPSIETIFLVSSDGTHFISSHFIKEIARLGGDVQPFVSPPVADRLLRRMKLEVTAIKSPDEQHKDT